MRELKQFAVTIAGAAILAACHGGGIDSDQGSGASPSLGLVQNALVNFYQADGATLIGSGETGTQGSVRIERGDYSGPVIIEVLGDDTDAMYFDESTGAMVAFSAGNALHALVPDAVSEVGVTPLTEIAYQAAVAQSLLPISASAVNELNNIVRDALAPGLSNLLSVPARFDENTTAGSLADNEGGRYALILAALAELNSGDASPALTTLNALVADLVDGSVDGQNNGSPVPNAGWGANFIRDMTTALNSVAGNFGNADLQGSAPSQAPASTVVDTGGVFNSGGDPDGSGEPNGETTGASVNAALVGTFDLVYAQTTQGAPFTDGQVLQAVVGSDNSLQLPGVPLLTNPFFRSFGSPNTAEVIWLDSVSHIEYALSNNDSGTFNEINVGDASNPQSTSGIPGFLGQLRMEDEVVSGGAPPELAVIAGQYMGQIVSKSGSFSRGRSLEDMILVNIDADSVVTVDSQFEFDPAASGYDFSDNRSNPNESSYQIQQVTDGANSLQFDIIFEDATGSTPIAYRLQSTQALGGGSFQVSTLELEKRPLPDEVTGFFSAMIADSPVALTAVSVDDGFNSPFAVCDELSLVIDNGSGVNSSNSRTPLRYRLNDIDGLFKDSEIYRRSYTRYTENNGDKSLLFLRNRIVRRADGFIDFTGTDAQNSDRSLATNDPNQISAACGAITLASTGGGDD